MKQAEPCGYSYGFSGCLTTSVSGVPMPVALRALDAVLVIQADVEPDRRVERPVLVQAEPGQLAVEPLAVFGAGEVAVVNAPIGNRAADAMDQLPHAVFALRRANFAVEVLAHDDVGGQLAPEWSGTSQSVCSNSTSPDFALDGGGAQIPLDGVERVGDIGRAKHGFDRQATCPYFKPVAFRSSQFSDARFREIHFRLRHIQLLLRNAIAGHPYQVLCTSIHYTISTFRHVRLLKL